MFEIYLLFEKTDLKNSGQSSRENDLLVFITNILFFLQISYY
jgi:hypothetical protein